MCATTPYYFNNCSLSRYSKEVEVGADAHTVPESAQ